MKDQSEPITGDEWLIRLIWEDRVTDRVPIVSANAFEPRPNETEGISFFRRACLQDVADALIPFAEEKRARYAIVQVPVTLLEELGLTVRADAIVAVPGHVVVPEINITAYLGDKARFAPIKARLAEIASENLLLRPAKKTGG